MGCPSKNALSGRGEDKNINKNAGQLLRLLSWRGKEIPRVHKSFLTSSAVRFRCLFVLGCPAAPQEDRLGSSRKVVVGTRTGSSRGGQAGGLPQINGSSSNHVLLYLTGNKPL